MLYVCTIPTPYHEFVEHFMITGSVKTWFVFIELSENTVFVEPQLHLYQTSP